MSGPSPIVTAEYPCDEQHKGLYLSGPMMQRLVLIAVADNLQKRERERLYDVVVSIHSWVQNVLRNFSLQQSTLESESSNLMCNKPSNKLTSPTFLFCFLQDNSGMASNTVRCKSNSKSTNCSSRTGICNLLIIL